MRTELDETIGYVNKNMPLTSGIARSLIPVLFAGKGYVKRSEIIKVLSQYHIARGGKDTRPSTQEIIVRYALRDLEKACVVERNPDTQGYWKILDKGE